MASASSAAAFVAWIASRNASRRWPMRLFISSCRASNDFSSRCKISSGRLGCLPISRSSSFAAAFASAICFRMESRLRMILAHSSGSKRSARACPPTTPSAAQSPPTALAIAARSVSAFAITPLGRHATKWGASSSPARCRLSALCTRLLRTLAWSALSVTSIFVYTRNVREPLGSAARARFSAACVSSSRLACSTTRISVSAGSMYLRMRALTISLLPSSP
mmetsp:Transcript_10852/g.37819  ORF Transcript_10852/g.37819 Transcript_10852/m.37819 type:complete len:222 (+) Transcript_10852:1122-1787(+)